MSVKTQAKVLRALQEQVVEPVGGQSSVRVDVRVIAATNKDLAEEIRSGAVPRGSLLPAERHSDFRAAAARARRRRDAAGGALRGGVRARVRPAAEAFSPEAVAVLRAYRWPGNVRELRNVIERLMIMVPGDVIGAADLTFLDVAGPRRSRAVAGRPSRRSTRRATPGSASTSSPRSPRSTATSHAPPTRSASSAAISTGRCAGSGFRRGERGRRRGSVKDVKAMKRVKAGADGTADRLPGERAIERSPETERNTMRAARFGASLSIAAPAAAIRSAAPVAPASNLHALHFLHDLHAN